MAGAAKPAAVPPLLHAHWRPNWKCSRCGGVWPCAAAQGELRARFQQLPLLHAYMAERLVLASADLPGTPAGLLHHHFIEWVLALDVHKVLLH